MNIETSHIVTPKALRAHSRLRMRPRLTPLMLRSSTTHQVVCILPPSVALTIARRRHPSAEAKPSKWTSPSRNGIPTRGAAPEARAFRPRTMTARCATITLGDQVVVRAPFLGGTDAHVSGAAAGVGRSCRARWCGWPQAFTGIRNEKTGVCEYVGRRGANDGGEEVGRNGVEIALDLA